MKKLVVILLLALAISGCVSDPNGDSFWRPVDFDLNSVHGEA